MTRRSEGAPADFDTGPVEHDRSRTGVELGVARPCWGPLRRPCSGARNRRRSVQTLVHMSAAPAATSIPAQRGWGVPLVVLIAGMFMSVLDISIVNVAIPTIQTDFGVDHRRHPVDRDRLLAGAGRGGAGQRLAGATGSARPGSTSCR